MKINFKSLHKTSFYAFWGASLFALCILKSAMPSEAIVSNASLSNYSVPFETIGLPTSTTVQFQIDNGDVNIVIYRIQNVTDTPNANNTVANISQGSLTAGSYQVWWPALWEIGGDNGRQNGSFKVIVSQGSSSFVIGQTLQITSVDIHNVTVTPSFDGNGAPAFPFAIQYALAKDALVTVQVKDASGTVVRTLASNAPQSNESLVALNKLSWNGLDNTNRPVPLGVYTITIDAKDANSPDVAITRTRTVAVSSLANLESDLKQLFDSNVMIYPNPVRNGQATFQALAVRNNATIHLKVYTLAGDLVLEKTFPNLATASAATFTWNATNQGGKKVGRGLYYFVVRQEDPEGTLQTVKKVAVIP
jgi:flagellar hook assembly protein FlgD